MYQIYADDVLIYDSTLEDYKIDRGTISLEIGKSGSFTFAIYPDHFFYNQFVELKTVITVYKSGRIVFRGRVLNNTVDYWNNKVLTCEGELGFLQDSIVRPYEFKGSPAALFTKFINDHNSQVDDFKKFKIGTIDIDDANDYINRSTSDYSTTQSMLASALIDSDLGGYFYITHGDDGADPIPTIHYVKDFPKVSSQSIEFGANLKDYVKTTDAADIATAIVPLGSVVDSDNHRLTIKDVNGGLDYVYHAGGVALRGWVFKAVTWEDVTLANNLKTKAEAYLESIVNQNITIELNAIDLHLLDRSIESFNVCDYVHVISKPHDFDAVLLCNKQTLDLLKPENDKVTLGYQTSTFTGANAQMAASVSTIGKTVSTIKQDAESVELSVEELGKSMSAIQLKTDGLTLSVDNGSTSASIQLMAGDENLGEPVEIKMDGLVTFTGLADGSTSINGGCIKTGYISADRIQAGSITLGKLSQAVKDSMGGLSEDEVTTLITDELISSPIIKGGKFEAQSDEIWIEMSCFKAGYGGLEVLNNGQSTFYVYSDYEDDFAAISMLDETFVILQDGVFYAYGNWDFSNATVTGL